MTDFIFHDFDFSFHVLTGISGSASPKLMARGFAEDWVTGSRTDIGNALRITRSTFVPIHNINYPWLSAVEWGEVLGLDESVALA
jgi:hypothetical protein